MSGEGEPRRSPAGRRQDTGASRPRRTSRGSGLPAGARSARRGFLAAGLGVFAFWNLGTLLGALGGDVLGDTDRFGLDAAFPACFLALLAPHLRTLPGRVAALLAGAIAVLAIPFVPVGVPILLGALAIVPAGALRSHRRTTAMGEAPEGEDGS